MIKNFHDYIIYLYNPFLLSVICKICRRTFDIHQSTALWGGSQNLWDTSTLKTSLEDKARQNTISIWNWSQNIDGHSQNVVKIIVPFYCYKNCNGNLQLMFIFFLLISHQIRKSASKWANLLNIKLRYWFPVIPIFPLHECLETFIRTESNCIHFCKITGFWNCWKRKLSLLIQAGIFPIT